MVPRKRDGRGGLKREVTGVGLNIAKALKKRGYNPRQLSAELSAKGVRGASYSNVWNYLNLKVEPPSVFVAAVAEMLDVSEAWLTTGKGPRSRGGGEAQLATSLRVSVSREARLLEMKRITLNDLSIVDPAPSEVSYWLGPLAEIWLRSGFNISMSRIIRGPIDMLVPNAKKDLDVRTFGEYVLAIIPALMILTRAAGDSPNQQYAALMGEDWIDKAHQSVDQLEARIENLAGSIGEDEINELGASLEQLRTLSGTRKEERNGEA